MDRSLLSRLTFVVALSAPVFFAGCAEEPAAAPAASTPAPAADAPAPSTEEPKKDAPETPAAEPAKAP